MPHAPCCRPATVAAVAAVALLAACAPTPAGSAADTGQAQARAAILRADSAFADSTAATGPEGWTAFFAADGVMFPPRGRIDGQEAIRAAMEGAFAPGTPMLRWHPVDAVVGGAGDLGYTLGRWSSVLPQPDGRDSVLSEGNYVTIWRRQADGTWRVAVDIGNRDPEP
jgi:ketosteroid isomerase-like protein